MIAVNVVGSNGRDTGGKWELHLSAGLEGSGKR
jgi:hypothetical protein